ncbi:glycosyltransferase family 39 protein [Halobaculum halobium]|uniref:Glycosyltransferase family 39 protein n=1 Tax=Halobaculum halobium TaxID=3032281 RepID=A0ABD5TI12_9EURY|nr:glycosyltransferase family 39 protein [Halobaculum sp. SYNS20]
MRSVAEIEEHTGIDKNDDETIKEYVKRASEKSKLSRQQGEKLAEALASSVNAPDESLDEEVISLFEDLVSSVDYASSATKSSQKSEPESHSPASMDSTDASKASCAPITRSDEITSDILLSEISKHVRFEDSTQKVTEDLRFGQLNLAFRLVRYLPVAFLIPLLTTKIPLSLSPAREYAGYYQAFAFIRDPIQSFTYITLQESDAALHLSSILASPLVALGYVEGGRLVSFGATVVAAVCLAVVAKELFGRRVALLAPVALLANPYFIRYSWTIYPESVSVATTVAALAAILKYIRTSDEKWFYVSIAVALLGITNHSWEAIIGLPLVIVLLWRSEWKKITTTTIAIFSMVGMMFIATGFQPNPAETMKYAVINTGPGLLWSGEWWSRWFQVINRWPMPPYFAAHRLHMLLAFPTIGFWSWTARQRELGPDVMVGWLISGLTIPFFLPGGVNHSYYLWGLMAPMSLTAAALVGQIVDKIEQERTKGSAQACLRVIAIFAVIVASGSIVVHEGSLGPTQDAVDNFAYPASGPAGYTGGVALGRELKAHGVESRSDVVFVGNWSYNSFNGFYRGDAVRILTYSGVPMNGTWHYGAVPGARETSPELVDSKTQVNRDHCEAMVIRYNNGSTTVDGC